MITSPPNWNKTFYTVAACWFVLFVAALLLRFEADWAAIGSLPVALALWPAIRFVGQTRLTLNGSGIRWENRPFPVPIIPSVWPAARFLPTGQIAAIYVGADRNVYSSGEVIGIFALSKSGVPWELLSHGQSYDAASELATFIASQLGLSVTFPPKVKEPPASGFSDAQYIFATVFALMLFLSLALFATFPIRTFGKVGTPARISGITHVTKRAKYRNYQAQRCVVRFPQPAKYVCPPGYLCSNFGDFSSTLDEDCPASSSKGDSVIAYYEAMHPEHSILVHKGDWGYGFLFLIPALAGLLYCHYRPLRV